MSNPEDEHIEEELREIHDAVMSHEPEQVTRRGNARQWSMARQKAVNKQQITARFDADLIAQYKELAGEGSYQRLMNQALREWLEERHTEEMVRKVIREELASLKHSA